MTTPHDKLIDPFLVLCQNLSTDEMREVSDALSDEAYERDRQARGDTAPVTLDCLLDGWKSFTDCYNALSKLSIFSVSK